MQRHYITSPKLISQAKEYFGSNNIIGIELDIKSIKNEVSSHWEPRILLGDYTANEDQAISEITLN